MAVLCNFRMGGARIASRFSRSDTGMRQAGPVRKFQTAYSVFTLQEEEQGAALQVQLD